MSLSSLSIDGQRRIIILSDIHANFPALQSVISFIKDDDIVICLGDMVGYYTEPNEVCEFIRTRANFVIAGNHDLYCIDTIPFKIENERKYRVFETRKNLKDSHKEWLRSLPNEMTIKLETPCILNTPLGQREIHQLQLAHGMPSNIECYIYPNIVLPPTPPVPSNTLLLLGHTHHPMIRLESFGILLNPGSVGQPRDWNPKPSYAVIEFNQQSITNKRCDYDWDIYAQFLSSQNIDMDSITLLKRQKN